MERLENLRLVELNEQELVEIEGGWGPLLVVIGVASGVVTLYEWGYQYAKRHLENAK